MAIKMVRIPSETPNINNIDDIVGLRYSYGNQDGYIKNKGNELDYSINGSNFTIKSGRVVLQGVESDIDANGVVIAVDNVSEKRYFTVYYEVNLAINTTSIKSIYDISTYPPISKGDNLTHTTNGISRLELYHFTAQNGVISNVEKLVKLIEYQTNLLKDTKYELNSKIDNKGTKNNPVARALSADSAELADLAESTNLSNNAFLRVLRNMSLSDGYYIFRIVIGYLKTGKYSSYTSSIATVILNRIEDTVVFIPVKDNTSSYGSSNLGIWITIASDGKVSYAFNVANYSNDYIISEIYYKKLEDMKFN